MGDIQYNVKHYDEAIAHYVQIAERFPESGLAPGALYWIAQAEAEQDRYPEAVLTLHRLIAVYPGDTLAPEALYRMGAAYVAMDSLAWSITPYERVLADYDTSDVAPEAGLALGRVYLALGRRLEALDALRVTIERYPETTPADSARVTLARLAMDDFDYALADTLLLTVIGRRTDALAAEAQYTMGDFLARHGQLEQAEEAFLKVKYLYPEAEEWVTRALLAAGDLRVAKGREREARQLFEEGADAPAAGGFG